MPAGHAPLIRAVPIQQALRQGVAEPAQARWRCWVRSVHLLHPPQGETAGPHARSDDGAAGRHRLQRHCGEWVAAGGNHHHIGPAVMLAELSRGTSRRTSGIAAHSRMAPQSRSKSARQAGATGPIRRN